VAGDALISSLSCYGNEDAHSKKQEPGHSVHSMTSVPE
jgi:hypothetical protein